MFETSRLRRTVGVLRAVVAVARSEQITFLAAAIAYYAFASIIPLVLLTAVAASIIGGDAFAEEMVQLLGSTLTPASQDVLLGTLTTTTGRGSATLVGLAVLLWSALKVFRALDTSFSMVYGADTTESFVQTLVDGAVALVAVAVAVGSSVALVSALVFLDLPVIGEFGLLVEIFVLAAAFLPLYYLFPDVEMSVREAVPGAIFAGVGWTALAVGFRVYAEGAGTFALWGVLGAALLLVTWLYVGSILLLLGATLNAVLANRSTLQVEPEVAERVDRHLQNAGLRQTEPAMSDTDGDDEHSPSDAGSGHATDDAPSPSDAGSGHTTDDEDAPVDAAALQAEIDDLRAELESFEDDVEDRTLHRDEVESDLKRYVRRRVRRGKATGWGPYLVLLYGTVMTLGAFYTPFLTGGWAIFAMLVIWLSTLGLYVLMVLFGIGVNVLSIPSRLRDRIGDWRS